MQTKKSLRIAYDLGTDLDGKQLKRTRTYRDLDPDVEDGAIRTAAEALVGLTERAALYMETVTVNRLS